MFHSKISLDHVFKYRYVHTPYLEFYTLLQISVYKCYLEIKASKAKITKRIAPKDRDGDIR